MRNDDWIPDLLKDIEDYADENRLLRFAALIKLSLEYLEADILLQRNLALAKISDMQPISIPNSLEKILEIENVVGFTAPEKTGFDS